MKDKPRSSFSSQPEEEGPEKKKSSPSSSSNTQPSGKTSLDPLYDTTDRYRKVIKPMKVEDFLTS